MQSYFENIEYIFSAGLCFFAAWYAIRFGILSVQNKRAAIPSIDTFGLALARKFHGELKVADKEQELRDPRKLRRLGILFILIGVTFFVGGVVIVFELIR